MKKALFSTVFLLVVTFSMAQQDAQMSMNVFNKLAVNPAYAGMNKAFCATMFYRQQWVGLEGAPQTGLINLDYGRVLGGGIGLIVDQDKIGFEKLLKAKLAYSYHAVLYNGILGVGLDAGMIQKSLSGDFVAPDGLQTDAAIPWGGSSVTTYDVGFGLYYKTRRFYLGASSTHLPANLASVDDPSSGGSEYKYTPARHYYVMAGYEFQVDRMWAITPSILTKSVLATTQLDVNLIAKWNKMLFIGGSYRVGDAAVVMGGLEKKFSSKVSAKFGYSYDITLSNIKNHSSGTHEIMLGMCYKIVPDAKTQRHQNVRFL